MNENKLILTDLFFKILENRANVGEIEELEDWLKRQKEIAAEKHRLLIAGMKGETD